MSEHTLYTLVGIDDGNEEIKIAYYDANGELAYARFPATAEPGNKVGFSLLEATVPRRAYRTSEGLYTVGQVESPMDNHRNNSYPFSASNRAIVFDALLCANIPKNKKIAAASGLPMRSYFLGEKQINKPLIKKKRDNLMLNDVVSIQGESMHQFGYHVVNAECVSAWMDYVTFKDKNGRIVHDSERLNKNYVLIDIGGRTSDIIVVKKGGDFQDHRSQTFDLGIANIRNTLENFALSGRLIEGKRLNLSREQIDELIKIGSVSVSGERYTCSDIVESVKKEFAESLMHKVSSTISNFDDIDEILFLGGTSIVLKNYLERWSFGGVEVSGRLLENPAFANARGLLKFVEMHVGVNSSKKSNVA